jgi:hypothetical protein
MPRYLISFDDGSMDHIPEQDWPAVGESSHAVVRDAKAAGVWIFGGGVLRQQSSIVATDGTVTDGPVPETKAVVGGFSIIEVSSREEALAWAARIAEACRCPQEVREIMFDPESRTRREMAGLRGLTFKPRRVAPTRAKLPPRAGAFG